MASDVVRGHGRYTLVRGDVPMMHLHSSLKGATVVAPVLGLLLIATCLPAAAVTYDITQDGVNLGSIMPFSGTQTAAAFYDFGGPHIYSGEPAGVPLAGSTSVLYVYLDNNTGDHCLGWIHGKEGETPSLMYMEGTIEITDDVASPSVLVSDDTGIKRVRDEPHLAAGLDELAADPGAARTFLGNWGWGPNRTDGGVVGPIGDTICYGGATVTITSLHRQSAQLSWMVASGDGSWIPLTTEENNPVNFHATPELPPFALASLALPLSWLRCRFRRNKKK